MDICTMPEAELQKLKRTIPCFEKRTPEQQILAKQISWIEMVDCCYCYGQLDKLPEYIHDRYLYAPLSVDMMKQMTDEHVAYLQKNAVIDRSVYQDFEGVTYNSMSY